MIRHKHTLPSHAMPCHASVGLAWRGKARDRTRVWGKVLHPHPLIHVLIPNTIRTGPSFSKLNPAAPIF